jgi:hypothetical protein
MSESILETEIHYLEKEIKEAERNKRKIKRMIGT